MYYVKKGDQQDSADLTYDDEFEDYVPWVKGQEGTSKGHVPHVYIDSAGVPTVGYGHTNKDTINKLQFSGESLHGISEEEADRLLRLDLSKNFDTLRQRMANLGRLDANAKYMLLDYEFNLGDINIYPQMRDAVLNRDWDSALYQFERYYTDDKTGESKVLEYRNQSTYDHFLSHRFETGGSLTEEEYWETQESSE